LGSVERRRLGSVGRRQQPLATAERRRSLRPLERPRRSLSFCRRPHRGTAASRPRRFAAAPLRRSAAARVRCFAAAPLRGSAAARVRCFAAPPLGEARRRLLPRARYGFFLPYGLEPGMPGPGALPRRGGSGPPFFFLLCSA